MRRERNQYIFASELTKGRRSHKFRNTVLVLLPILILLDTSESDIFHFLTG